MFAILACVLQSVRSLVTEKAVQDLVQRIAHMEEHMNSAGHAIRAAEDSARAADSSNNTSRSRRSTPMHSADFTGRHQTGETFHVQWSAC